MRFLRTNTAIRLTVGPFFDKTDGVTPETGITVTSCKLTLMVDDGNVPTLVLDTAPTASGGANDMVHVTGDDAGFYDLELAAANLNYLGRAMLAITDAAVHCPVFHEFMILPANIYDSLVLGTDLVDVSVTQFAGSAITSASGIPEVKVASIANGAVTAAAIATDAIDDDAIATGAIASTAFAAGAITATVIATGAIDADALAADAVTEIAAGLPTAAGIADAVWDEDATAHQTGGTFGMAIGDPAASTETLYKAIITDPAGTNIAADVIAIKAETAGLVTSVDALPTNAELATALGTADDAVLAAIAALNNLSSSAAATAVLTTVMTESYAADGAAPTLAQAIFLIQQALTEFAISSTTLTIKKVDGSTTAATLTLNDATTPTGVTRAS